MPVRTLSEHACWDGTQGFYEHDSQVVGLPMRFSVYTPPEARDGPVPLVLYLAGLTCTEETFPIKAGAQRLAAEHGLMLLAPDTSPRGTGIATAGDDWEFGTAASFYLDALRPPWSSHWKMESWIIRELLPLVLQRFGGVQDRVGVFGHSMGGHGAIVLALRNPGRFKSISALAPIASPMECPWGRKAFAGYLGEDRELWARHDATALLRSGARLPRILVDQGLADKFLASQLKPHLLEQACEEVGQPITLRLHEGYDHGYYFVSTFMPRHLQYHADILHGP